MSFQIKISPVMKKTTFCICENKKADQLRSCSSYVPYYIVQKLYFLNPMFQYSSHVVWLHSLVCVRPGQNPWKRFCCVKAHIMMWVLCIISLPISLKPKVSFQIKMSPVMRKQVFCICENKGADQLRRHSSSVPLFSQ